MNDLFYEAAIITALIGMILLLAFVRAHLDEITQVFKDSVDLLRVNSLRILVFLFLVSLTVTGLASLGLI